MSETLTLKAPVYGQNFVRIEVMEPLVVDVPDRVQKLGVAGNDAVRSQHIVRLRQPFTIIGVRSFFGHDKGDSYETEVTIFGDTDPLKVKGFGRYVWDRIDEAVAPSGDERQLEMLLAPVQVQSLQINTVARVTGPNMIVVADHPSHKKWRGVFDYNIMLIGGS